MKDRALIKIEILDEDLQVKIDEDAYGNLALIGVLEKIKLGLINDIPTSKRTVSHEIDLDPDTDIDAPRDFQKYDA